MNKFLEKDKKLTLHPNSSNVVEVIKTVLNIFIYLFFLQKASTRAKSTKKHKNTKRK